MWQHGWYIKNKFISMETTITRLQRNLWPCDKPCTKSPSDDGGHQLASSYWCLWQTAYSLPYISQTVKVFLHIQEQSEVTGTHMRTGGRMFQSFPCQVMPWGSMHIHSTQCLVNTSATMLCTADSPQTFGSTLHSEFSPLKLMVKNDITDMFRCGQPCWCH